MGHPRKCFWYTTDSDTPAGWVPALVVEGEPDPRLLDGGEHGRPWIWGTDFHTAWQILMDCNRRDFDLSDDDVRDIVTSAGQTWSTPLHVERI